MRSVYAVAVAAMLVFVCALPLSSDLAVSGPSGPTSSGYFGQYGELSSLPMFYINDAGSVPTEENTRPLVAYLDIGGSPLRWNYHGILMYQAWLYYFKWGGPGTCQGWYDDLFGVGVTQGGLDTLDTVVGNLKGELAEPNYQFNVVIAVCYEPGSPNANPSVDYVVNAWTSKDYQHLTLVGFYWGYSEFVVGEGQDFTSEISQTAMHIHGYGLKLYAIPYFGAWYPPLNDWHALGTDYVIGQPNYAFNPPQPWRFPIVDQDIQSGFIDGAHLEISYTCRDFNPPNPNCLSREDNANDYLDAGFQYQWMKNVVNGFYYSPGYLDAYAMGGGRANIPTYDRPIYCRAHQFVRNYEPNDPPVITSADAFVNEFFPDMNYGLDTRLLMGTNAAPNKMRTYVKFGVNDLEYAYITKATLSLYLSRWVYGSVITDGELYKIGNNSWTELGLTWNTQPPEPTWSLLESSITFSSTGWYDFDVTNAIQGSVIVPDAEVTFMLKRQNENWEERELVFHSKEGSFLLSPRLTIEYVSSICCEMPTTEDSFVAGAIGFQDENYGTVPYFVLGTNTYPNALRPYLKYWLDALPDSDLLHAGYIMLYLTTFYYGSTNITDGELHLVSDDSWEEELITWNNQPLQSTWSLLEDDLYFSEAYTVYSFTVLDEIKSEHNLDDRGSFMFKRALEDGTLHECGFWSNDYTDDLHKRAQLRVRMRAY